MLLTSDNGPHDEGGDGAIYDESPGYVHSPEFFDSIGPLRGYKRNLYEGGIRVPMIAWSPGSLDDVAGVVSDHPWTAWDLLPTLADYASAQVPSDIDGISMRPALEGRQQSGHDFLYWFRNTPLLFPHATVADGGRTPHISEAVRRDNWKALRFTPQQPPQAAVPRSTGGTFRAPLARSSCTT